MNSRGRLWLLWAIGMVATYAVYAVWLGPLETILRAGGHGILDLEFAWTSARFEGITTAWGSAGVRAAQEQIWWDFLWIPSYVVTIWASLKLAGAARLALMAVPVAGACDVVENIALLRGLHDTSAGLVVPVTSLIATIKFALLAFALVVLIWAIISRLRRRSHPAKVSSRDAGSPSG